MTSGGSWTEPLSSGSTLSATKRPARFEERSLLQPRLHRRRHDPVTPRGQERLGASAARSVSRPPVNVHAEDGSIKPLSV